VDEQRIREWHEAAYESLREVGELRLTYLEREFVVPPQVFPPAPASELLGRAVLADVRETDRVLDMGTGSGVNAILAASRSRAVLGVDVNPLAVAAAAANAELNGVADRIEFAESDVFSAVDGRFDLMIFDPPFRWFAPRDLLEASMTDENYGALTRFLTQADRHLADGGRILMFFGTSGDLDYLHRVADEAGFEREVLSSRDLVKPELTVTYYALRLRKG
jgi:release factor glutamine methyltransferase